jgi:transposase-like protein
VRRLCFEWYGNGLTTRQVGEITEKIYGNHYSSLAVISVNQELAGKLAQWRQRPLQARYPVIYIDAIHVKVRREHVSSEAFYVVLGLTEDMQREVFGYCQYSFGIGKRMGRFARPAQGVRARRGQPLVVADGLKGLDKAIHRVFPAACHTSSVIFDLRQGRP